MTDRYNAFLVVMDRDIREDDAEDIITALKQIKGVIDVQPNIADFDSHIAHERARQELAEKLWRILYPKDGA
jgi:hypothetical protein